MPWTATDRHVRVLWLGGDAAEVTRFGGALGGGDDPGAPPVRVVHVADVAAAPGSLDAHAPDLVVLDFGPPLEPALQRLAELHSVRPELPVIGLIGAERHDRQWLRILDAGVYDCLPKNRHCAQLLAHTLQHALAHSRADGGAQARLARVQERGARFRTMVEASTDGILVVDRAGVIRFANPAAARMLDRPIERLIGDQFGFPIAGEAVEELEILRQGEAIGFAEMRVVPVSWGTEPALLALLRDVTRRRQAKARLRRSTAELEQRNKVLEDFALNVSHDLQAPLRRIRLLAERLEQRLGERLDARSATDCQHLIANARAMQALIRDLLAYARASIGTAQRRRVDLAEVVADVTARLAATLEETGGRIEAGPLPKIESDPAQLRQLLHNLIDNALKYRRPDVAPRIRIRAARRRCLRPVRRGQRHRLQAGAGGADLRRLPAPARPGCLPRHRDRARHLPAHRRAPGRRDHRIRRARPRRLLQDQPAARRRGARRRAERRVHARMTFAVWQPWPA